MAPRTWLGSFLVALLPSFLADTFRTDHRNGKLMRLHPTSYLDGLRGVASLIVFLCHYTENHHGSLVPSYGLNPGTDRSSPLQLPFVRIIYSGRPMVHLFFVISGFALSYKPLLAIHSGDLARCHAVLASSAFRRPLRLFGPCLASTFLVLLLTQAGLLYKPLPNFSSQLADWMVTVFHAITWPWSWDYDLKPTYDIHLWTIPIEFIHSMLLFVVILMLSPLRKALRLGVVFGLMLYCLCCGRWAGFEFLGGLLIAEVQMTRAGFCYDPTKPCEVSTERRRGTFAHMLRLAFHLTLLIPAWFIGGWPNEDAEKTPVIGFLLDHTPYPFNKMDPLAPQKFWFALSATLVVWSLSLLAPARQLLETPTAQYCGRISFAVYLVHGPVLDMFAKQIVGSAYTPHRGVEGAPEFQPSTVGSGVRGLIGVDAPMQRTLAWFLGLFVLAPIVIWTADLFWRFVDVAIVAMARRLEEWCVEH
jgi:peptidoglycan/LPS O-acetylase OafA/YrhL